MLYETWINLAHNTHTYLYIYMHMWEYYHNYDQITDYAACHFPQRVVFLVWTLALNASSKETAFGRWPMFARALFYLIETKHELEIDGMKKLWHNSVLFLYNSNTHISYCYKSCQTHFISARIWLRQTIISQFICLSGMRLPPKFIHL